MYIQYIYNISIQFVRKTTYSSKGFYLYLTFKLTESEHCLNYRIIINNATSRHKFIQLNGSKNTTLREGNYLSTDVIVRTPAEPLEGVVTISFSLKLEIDQTSSKSHNYQCCTHSLNTYDF